MWVLRQLVLIAVICFSPAMYAADVFKGREVYEIQCQSCHGVDGRGVLAFAPDFTRGERLLRSDLALLAAVSSGKGVMPAFEGVLSEREILNVIAYLRTLY